MRSMRVGTKLTVVTVLGVLLVLGAHGYQRVQRELALLTTDMERDHRTLAHGLALAAQAIADRSGIADAVALLEDANERESRMQITWSAPEAPPRRRAAGQALARVERSPDGSEEWLVSSVPLKLRGTQGTLEMRESLGQQRSYVEANAMRNALIMGEVALLCIIVIVGSGFLFVSRPMRLLLAKVRRIGAGDLSEPLELAQRDEMGELAREINTMCRQLADARARLESETRSRIAAVEQVRHADRLSIVGRLASGLAHELGTPLNVVLAHASIIARQPAESVAATADAEVIIQQAERMASIIRQLLDLARRHTPNKRPEDVRRIVGDTLSVIAPVAAKHGIRLHVDVAPWPVIAEIDAAQIQQVLANLVMNAIQAQPDGGQVRVSIDDADSNGDAVRVRVEDDGPGIPADARERIFEPFFTTKDPGEGTGLGLTVSYGIVTDHGGRIEVESADGEGSAFIVCLPAPQTAP
jgi:two-component system, NtrC family, sensor kinase